MAYGGIGCEKNIETAKFWLLKAIEKGNQYAMKAYKAHFGDISLRFKSDEEYLALLEKFEDCANQGIADRCFELHSELIIGSEKQMAKLGYVIANGKYNVGGLYENFDYPVREDGEPYAPIFHHRVGWKSFVRINMDAFDDENLTFCISWDGVSSWKGIEPLKWIVVKPAQLVYTSGEFGWAPAQKEAVLLSVDKSFFDESALEESGVSEDVEKRIRESNEAWFVEHGEKEYSVEICQIKDGKPVILYRCTIDGWDQGERASKAEILKT
jgi:hypothetical protein